MAGGILVEDRKVVTFGEVLLRLSPPGNRKFQQANQLDFFFGGTEMNVAISLSHFGVKVQHVTSVSNDFVGEAAISMMRKNAIDVSAIKKVNHPLGLYFMEIGSTIRPSQITYNRLNGSFANISPHQVNWEEILRNCNYLHWTGISPAISESAYVTLRQGLQMASQMGITITADPVYRSNLWKYGIKAHDALFELLKLTNVFIGGVSEINEILDLDYPANKEGFIAASKKLTQACPSIEKVFEKVRTGVSASWQKVYSRAWTGENYMATGELEITDVIDRIGTGDAFAAGLIYGLEHFDDKRALDFANAACALKHTIVGDSNLATVEEILQIAKGNIQGRLKR